LAEAEDEIRESCFMTEAGFFKYKNLLKPPVRRAAYSDRTAWLMAEMARLAYLKFEIDQESLKHALLQAEFELVSVFNQAGTQAFLANRSSDGMLVLAFRGTEKEGIQDVVADLNARFYMDKDGVKTHTGFSSAFQLVEDAIKAELAKFSDHALYVTGHSLGGALALIATRTLNSDNLAACYTFGSPKVGCEDFDDEIKPPIYRIVNAYDIVPFCPPTHLIDVLSLIRSKELRQFLGNFKGYIHHGDMRHLTACGSDVSRVKVEANPNDFILLFGLWKNYKECVNDHSIETYCEKLGQWALKRLNT
jgi:hypothetical protein